MKQQPKVVLIYLLYYHVESHVDDVVSSLKKMTYDKDQVEVVIVSNPMPDKGHFLRYIDETVMPLSGKEIPHVTVLPQKENIGFAGGNNAGVEWALENGFDYVFFYNNDGFLATNAIEPLVNTLESNPDIGIAQSLMLLHPETDLVNSTGNAFHFLGFGFCNDYRKPVAELDLPPVKDVSYASGAAFMISTKLIKEYGMWDHDFFLYHEDFEWSFRIRCAGYRVVLVRDSVFYHKYQFSRSIQKFYWMERNRYGVMLMFFKWRTLLLLLPMEIVLEAGLFLFAAKGGWLDKRFAVYKYWLQPKHWKLWLKKRAFIFEIKKKTGITDKTLLLNAVPEILFQDPSMRNPLLIYIGNPIMKLYYNIVVKGIIRW